MGYFLIVAQVKKLLLAIKPDIVNAHYASGYGTTARLVNYHPYVLSVWGSDIYLFPKKSFIHHWLVNKNLLASSYDDIRFEQSNEIYYCINSILKFMPWVRNIYLVTDQQTPFFLEENNSDYKNVIIVDHREIFYGLEEYLPTFNSRSLASCFWRIKNISEYFIVFNDDLILLNPISYNLFFSFSKKNNKIF